MSKINHPPFCFSHLKGAKLKLINQGKVRDIYQYSEDELLIIASDRISAFDQVLETPIKNKGVILTQLAYFWLNKMSSLVQTHLKDGPINFEQLSKKLSHLNLPKEVLLRAMLVKKIKPLPIEAVVRGYLVGSGYREYQQLSSVCGIKLPKGLKEAQKLNQPIFTPASKAEFGSHDENISFEMAAKLIGVERISQIKELSLKIYNKAYDYCLTKGIIIADTKFEFGLNQKDEIVLIDEVLTPDSSRFFSLKHYQQGGAIKIFDKQIVRDYLLEQEKLIGKMPLVLPKKIILKSQKRYQKILNIITN